MNLLNLPNYSAWNWDYKKFPRKENIEDKIKFFIESGILAASIHNTQPWKFEIQNNSLHIFPNWKYKLAYADPSGKNIFISIGCCIANIECVAAYYGFESEVMLSNQIQSPIRIKFIEGPSNKDLAGLCPYITRRYSNKLMYLDKPIPREILSKLNNIRVLDRRVVVIENKQTIHAVAELQEKSVMNVSGKFTQEIASWVRNNNSKSTDGMPGFVEGFSPGMAKIGKFMLGYFPWFFVKMLAKKNKLLIKNSPAIGLISSSARNINSAISIGRAYERVALTAISLGINCTPMHAVIEDKDNSQKLKKLLKLKKNPEFLFRLGYSDNRPYHTPRRSINSFLFNLDSEKKLVKKIDSDIKIKQVIAGKYIVNYAQIGSGAPVLLLHGLNIGWGQWYPNLRELAKKFTVFALDLPGCGNSGYLDFKISNFEKDFVETIESFIQVHKLRHPIVLGHSFGGSIALKVSLNNKSGIKKLILVDPIGFTKKVPLKQKLVSSYFIAQLLSKTVMKPSRINTKNFLTSVMNKKDNLIEEFIDYYYDAIISERTIHPIIFIHSLLKNFVIKKEIVFYEHLKRVNVPTLILGGIKDPIMQELLRSKSYTLIQRNILEIFNESGHVPNIEESEKFNHVLSHFLT